MTTVHDVPANPLIERLAARLQETEEVEPPAWAPFVKTGVHKERPPEQDDWWFLRSAAILRKVYLNGPVGTARLQGHYGGKRNRGSKPHRVRKGSGSVIRNALQQLEAAGLLETVQGQGRRVTPEGQSLVDNVAHEVQDDLVDEVPELAKY